MAISKVTKDLRRLLDAQNIPWEDHSGPRVMDVEKIIDKYF